MFSVVSLLDYMAVLLFIFEIFAYCLSQMALLICITTESCLSIPLPLHPDQHTHSLSFHLFETGSDSVSPDCPGTLSKEQAGFRFRDPLSLASLVLGLKMCATTSDPILCLLVNHLKKHRVFPCDFNLHLPMINDVDCCITCMSSGDRCLVRSFAYF